MRTPQLGEPGDAHHITVQPIHSPHSSSHPSGYGYGFGNGNRQWITKCACGWSEINVTAALGNQQAQAHRAT